MNAKENYCSRGETKLDDKTIAKITTVAILGTFAASGFYRGLTDSPPIPICKNQITILDGIEGIVAAAIEAPLIASLAISAIKYPDDLTDGTAMLLTIAGTSAMFAGAHMMGYMVGNMAHKYLGS